MIAKALEKVNAMTAEKNPKKCPELAVGDIVADLAGMYLLLRADYRVGERLCLVGCVVEQ